jgi:hypothetical protein
MAITADLFDLTFLELALGNLARARESLLRARDRVVRERWTGFLPFICVAGAALASAAGDHRRAAQMAGVAAATFVSCGQTPDPDEAAMMAYTTTAAIDALGAETFAVELAQGELLGPSAALQGI